jgi:hypothetical protein
MMESKSSSVTSVSIFHNIGTTSQKIAIVVTARHTKPDHTLSQTICREIPNVVVNTPASYAEAPGLNPDPQTGYSEVSRGFSKSLQANAGIVP